MFPNNIPPGWRINLPSATIPPSPEYVALLRERDRRERRLIRAAAWLLRSLLGLHPPSGTIPLTAGLALTDRIITELEDAATDYWCGDNARLIASHEQAQAAADASLSADLPGNRAMSGLVYLVKERDLLQEQIEVAERGQMAMETVPGMADVVEGTMLLPLRRRLNELDAQISIHTREMSKDPPAADN